MENPLVAREWRGLVAESRDWRLWLGLRLPKDARGWGLPAMLWFTPMPYALSGLLQIAWSISPEFRQSMSSPLALDVLRMVFGLCSFYLVVTSGVLMATSLAKERETGSLPLLLATHCTSLEIVLGLCVGRLGPILAAFGCAGLFWTATYPHYRLLLAGFSSITITQVATAQVVVVALATSFAVGSVGLCASAWSRRSATALVAAMVTSMVLFGISAWSHAAVGLATTVSVLALIAMVAMILAVVGIDRQRQTN